MKGYRVNVYSSHKILGRSKAALGGRRYYTLSEEIPSRHYKTPFATKREAEKAVDKKRKYNEIHNKRFFFRYKIVKV